MNNEKLACFNQPVNTLYRHRSDMTSYIKPLMKAHTTFTTPAFHFHKVTFCTAEGQ